MNDIHTKGAAIGMSFAFKRRIFLFILVFALLFIPGAPFAPQASFAQISKKTSLPANTTAQKASPPAKKVVKKPSPQKNATKRPTYIHSLSTAEDRSALLDRGFSSGFGPRAGSKKRVSFHKGIDVPAPKDSKILAFNDGTVTFFGDRGAYGKTLVVKQIDGREALYAHMNKTVVKVGDTIRRGDHIGHVGRTGRATGYHLHFELIDDGENIDPAEHVWHSAELVLGPGELNPSTPPESSVAQQNGTSIPPLHPLH